MSRAASEKLIARHEAFLHLEPVSRPLLGFWLGGYYPAEQFPNGAALWRDGQQLQPQDVSFQPFAADYESLCRVHQAAEDDFFYVGSAYWGIPWMEAVLGCPVVAAASNCRAEACLNHLDKMGVDVLLPCINGAFGNMNHLDAARLVEQAAPRMAIPCHFWTFAEQGAGDPYGFIHACRQFAPAVKSLLLRPGEGLTVKAKKRD